VLHGLTGKYEVNGQKFEGAMPVPQVGSDEDIASVLTYVRRSFGNTAEPIPAAEVLRVREKNASRTRSWSREELDRSPVQ
jgi:mono/diheme cytochrome c family protein